MPENNFEKMMRVIDEAFATRQDPGQLQMNNAQRKKLEQVHPATMLEKADENGPLVWVLLIPTTKSVMQKFVDGSINEKQLLELTEPGQIFEAVYLCSATTLPEARGKGYTKDLCMQGLREIMKDHPVEALYVWPFSEGGIKLSQSIAKESNLPLLVREHQEEL